MKSFHHKLYICEHHVIEDSEIIKRFAQHNVVFILKQQVVDGGKNPSQQRETLPVPQVPIDSRTFGVASSTGLWTHYRSKVFDYNFL